MMGINEHALRKLFPTRHIPNILRSVVEAGTILNKTTNTDREDQITYQLYKKLLRIPTFRDGPLDITMRPTIITKGEPDLRVSSCHGVEVYFALEAKRLRVLYPNGRLDTGNSEYVKGGMMRFITGKYAPYMRTGAMLGYVYDGNTKKARSGVNLAVKNKAVELKLRPPKRLKRSSILPKYPIDETCHDLSERSFIIYHIFIAV